MSNPAASPDQNRISSAAPRREKPFSLRRELAAILCLLAALGLFCGLSSRVLAPKRQAYGSVWGMYLQEPAHSLDVLVMGSSLAYCDVVPAVLYRETGLTSFVMAGPQQTLPVTYYYLREALKTQSPHTVLLELTGAFFEPDNRHVKTNLTFMPYNMNRWIPTFNETSGEDLLGLMFPLYAYHDRWDQLSAADLTQGLWGQQADLLAGYTFLDEATPVEAPSYRDDLDGDPAHLARAMDYLDQIRALCEERGIRLICFLSPAAQTIPPELLEAIQPALSSQGLTVVDFSETMDALSLDWGTDFYDPRHLNYRGAEKFSAALGRQLLAWGVAPRGQGDAQLWAAREEAFAQKRAAADQAPLKLRSGAEGGEGS